MTPDFVIIGAGIFGLTIADALASRDTSVMIIDAGKPGSGASGGILGALMPHMPNSWNDKKQFQFDALDILESFIAELEYDTGQSTGYGRVGRVMPIRKNGFLEQTRQRIGAAQSHWNNKYRFEILSADHFSPWLDDGNVNPHLGLGFDTLSARVEPNQYIRALTKRLGKKNIAFNLGITVDNIEDQGKRIKLSDGSMISTGQTILAAGHQSFRLLEKIGLPDLGGGVWGQAVRLKPKTPFQNAPVIYDNGIYIISHEDGYISVGSTSLPFENMSHDPNRSKSPIADLDKQHDMLTTAYKLSPSLKDAEIVSNWSGIRPKAWARDPMIGSLQDNPNLFVATGGFKISFGIAHHIAAYIKQRFELNEEKPISLPASFAIDHHITAASLKE